MTKGSRLPQRDRQRGNLCRFAKGMHHQHPLGFDMCSPHVLGNHLEHIFSAFSAMRMSDIQPILFRRRWGGATLQNWLCKQHHWQSATWDCPHRRLLLEHHYLRQCARQGWGMWRSMPLTMGCLHLLGLPAPTDYYIHKEYWRCWLNFGA